MSYTFYEIESCSNRHMEALFTNIPLNVIFKVQLFFD